MESSWCIGRTNHVNYVINISGLNFLSFSFLLYHNCLRWTLISLKVIAATVASDPIKYSETFLGKPNGEYCEWILNPEKWGGVFYFCYSFWWWYQGFTAYIFIPINFKSCDPWVPFVIFDCSFACLLGVQDSLFNSLTSMFWRFQVQ